MGALQTVSPDITINVAAGMYPAELNGKIKQKPVDDRLRMDSYSIFPSVPKMDYCNGQRIDLTVMYLPGSCAYAMGKKVFCIEGSQETLNPLAPRPIEFRYDKALERIKDAIKVAETDYQKEYNADVLKAVKPTAKFFPTLWDNMLTGALIAPTTSLKPDVAGLMRQGKEAGQNLGGVFKSTAPVYYLQGVSGSKVTQPLLVHTLPKRGEVLGAGNPSGVWPLEEAKRTFGLQPVPIADRFGYTSVFSAWTRPTAKLLPEDAQAKFLRQMIYGAVGDIFYLPSPVPAQ